MGVLDLEQMNWAIGPLGLTHKMEMELQRSILSRSLETGHHDELLLLHPL